MFAFYHCLPSAFFPFAIGNGATVDPCLYCLLEVTIIRADILVCVAVVQTGKKGGSGGARGLLSEEEASNAAGLKKELSSLLAKPLVPKCGPTITFCRSCYLPLG
eukprot:scaffold43118_cov31-Prasinocladus_malaysianus.AAC.1